LYPTIAFKKAYEALKEVYPGTKGDVAYLRILHLAASTMESDVQCALELILNEGELPEADRVKELVSPQRVELPDMPVLSPDLHDYNSLLSEVLA
jgi:hypothetical protein